MILMIRLREERSDVEVQIHPVEQFFIKSTLLLATIFLFSTFSSTAKKTEKRS